MIADIAAVFHWPKAEMEAMDLIELVGWQQRAIKRWNAMQGQD